MTDEIEHNGAGRPAGIPKETQLRMEAVAEAYRASPSLRQAALAANVHPGIVYAWRKKHPEIFIPMLEAAEEERRDRMREHAFIRAVGGWERPVIYRGEVMYKRNPVTGDFLLDDNYELIPITETVVSDSLMGRYLAAYLPEFKQGGSSVGVDVKQDGGEGGGGANISVQINFVEPPNWDDVEWDEDTGKPIIEGTGDETA